jgi:hypothetical protein
VIDPDELTPLQGGPSHWTFPGVETWLKPRAESCVPSGQKALPNRTPLVQPDIDYGHWDKKQPVFHILLCIDANIAGNARSSRRRSNVSWLRYIFE